VITIVDYGMGNLGSIANMIKKIGHYSEITSDISKIETASKIILPGVGSFDRAIKNLEDLGLVEVLKENVLQNKIPILGICLGMQIMTKNSEEGEKNGLGLLDAYVQRFKYQEDRKLKIPHMGWNLVTQQKDNLLFKGMESELRYYFVHSYHVVCNNVEDLLTTTNYGYDFVSSFATDNIFGVQFHPEKSHKFGMDLLKNFVEKF